jgi:hypothetical protein
MPLIPVMRPVIIRYKAVLTARIAPPREDMPGVKVSHILSAVCGRRGDRGMGVGWDKEGGNSLIANRKRIIVSVPNYRIKKQKTEYRRGETKRRVGGGHQRAESRGRRAESRQLTVEGRR